MSNLNIKLFKYEHNYAARFEENHAFDFKTELQD